MTRTALYALTPVALVGLLAWLAGRKEVRP